MGGEDSRAPAESQNLLFPELKGSPGDFVGMQEGKWELGDWGGFVAEV